MFNLIRKDFLALRWYFLFIAAYALFFGLLANAPFSPMIIGLMPGLMLTVLIANVETRNRSLMFVGSLPVRRQQIVLAKYATAIVYTAMGLLLAVAIGAIQRYAMDGDYRITASQLSLAAGISLAFHSLYYPFQYWLGVRNSNLISFAVIFLSAVGIGAIGNAADTLSLSRFSETQVAIALPLAGLLLFAASYPVSLAIFSTKDMEG